jgi:hypothetical protein
MSFVNVSISQSSNNYKSTTFSFSFGTSSAGVINNDGQIIEVMHGNTVLFTRRITGNLYNQRFSATCTASSANFAAQGSRHAFAVTVRTRDSRGDSRFAASASMTGHSLYTPRLTANMFKVTGGNATGSTVTYSGLDTPQNERLSYENWNQSGYRQTAAGSKSGTVSYTGLAVNTRKELAFGMIERAVDNGFLGNGDARRIMVPVYPVYSTLTKGTISAEYVQNAPGSVKVTWGAWSGLGNMTGWHAYIDIIDATSGSTLKTQNINALTANNATVTGVDMSKSISVRIRLTGRYHDNTTKTENSSTIALGYLNNTFVKINGTWRRGVATYIKINGTWRQNSGLIKAKIGGVWR